MPANDIRRSVGRTVQVLWRASYIILVINCGPVLRLRPDIAVFSMRHINASNAAAIYARERPPADNKVSWERESRRAERERERNVAVH